MPTSAQGIVKNVAMFRGVVRAQELFQIILVNDADEPIPNAKFEVTFQDGQTIGVEGNGKGVLKFPKKAQGEFEVKMLEEEEASTESSEGEVSHE